MDTIVVGAGPAGSVTALLLARAGLRVALLDRDEPPRAKPCGDCLSAAATAELRELGLLDDVLAAGPAHLDAWRIVSPAGHACLGRFDGTSALALERRTLDAILVDAAASAGAELRHVRVADLVFDGDRVAGVHGRGADGDPVSLRARCVIGADGLRSVVARRLRLVRRGGLRKLSLTTHGTGRLGEETVGEMHVVAGGCFGLAAAGPERFNLTLVVAGEHAPRLRQLGPERFFRAWLERVPSVRDRVGSAPLDLPFLASGPFDVPTSGAVRAGAALVGDAAGYFDPFTGQGIHHALVSARELVLRLAPALEYGRTSRVDDALNAYGHVVRRRAHTMHRVQKLLEVVLSRPRLTDAAVRRLAAAPAVFDRLIEVTGDLRPARALLSPALLSSFLLPPNPELEWSESTNA